MSPLQVNVKLHERRNEALKWELLRQGGCQETFDNIAKEVCGKFSCHIAICLLCKTTPQGTKLRMCWDVEVLLDRMVRKRNVPLRDVFQSLVPPQTCDNW